MAEKGEILLKSDEQLGKLILIFGIAYVIVYAVFTNSVQISTQIIEYQQNLILMLLWFYPVIIIIYSILTYIECIKAKIKFDDGSRPIDRFVFIIIAYISIILFFIGMIPFMLYYETSQIAYALLFVPPIFLFISIYNFNNHIMKLPNKISLRIAILTTVSTTIIIYIEFLTLILSLIEQSIIFSILMVQHLIGFFGIVISIALIGLIAEKLKDSYKQSFKLDFSEIVALIIIFSGYILLLNFVFLLDIF
jgi:hypothetical protein